MADENITDVQRQLSAAMLQVQNDLAQFGRVTQQSAEQLKDAQMKAKYGSESFTKGANTAAQALGALAGAGIESTKAMYEGKKGAAAFNSSLDELSKAAMLAGTALTLLMPGGIIMKGIVAGLTMATTAALAYTKAANDMADKLYQGYSKLQESGAAASDGMTGVFNDAKKLGLSMNQLDSYVSQVAANSQELALLSGSVTAGRKQFANMGEALESSREGFFKMGITQEQQNEGMMRYVKNMTLAGRAQNMTTKELADGARAYIYEQDRLTKLTGISAQKQQAILDRARESEQFNSKIRQLELKGDKESLAAADGLRKGLIMASAAGDDVAEGFMASVNGNIKNQKAQALFTTSYGANLTATQDILSGIDPEKAMAPMFKNIAQFEKTQGIQISMLEAGNDRFLKSNSQAKAALIAELGYEKAMEKIKADQLAQQQGTGDKVANEYGKLIKEQQDANKKLEQDVFKGVLGAVTNMRKLTGVTDKLADGFTHLTNGINKLLSMLGLGPEKDNVAEKDKEIKDVKKELALAKANQATATDPGEKATADREVKFYTEKLELLKKEKEAVVEDEKNKAYEKEVLKRADEDTKLKKAAWERQMKTATWQQKAGIGKTKEMKDAEAAYMKAHGEEQELVKSSGSGSKRQEQVEALKGSGWKPTKQRDATAPQGAGTTRQSLEEQRLILKQGDVQAEGADLSPNIVELAKNIQKNISGFGYFSGFNDNFHAEKASSSKHVDGLAADFTLKQKPSKEDGQGIVKWLKDQGASLAIDEYNNLSRHGTGGHIHVEIPTFAEGGDLAAGKLGIAGEAGPEFVEGPASITPMGDIMGVFNNMAMMMGKQVGAIDELVRIAKNGNDIQTKILRQQA